MQIFRKCDRILVKIEKRSIKKMKEYIYQNNSSVLLKIFKKTVSQRCKTIIILKIQH